MMKKYQEKMKKAYLAIKSATASGAPSGPQIPGIEIRVSAN